MDDNIKTLSTKKVKRNALTPRLARLLAHLKKFVYWLSKHLLMLQKTTPSFNTVYNKNGLRWCAIDLQRQLLISQFFKRGKMNTLKHKIFLIISSVIVTHSAYAQIFSNPESVTYDKKQTLFLFLTQKTGAFLKLMKTELYLPL